MVIVTTSQSSDLCKKLNRSSFKVMHAELFKMTVLMLCLCVQRARSDGKFKVVCTTRQAAAAIQASTALAIIVCC
jgi:hypothetical protein